MTVKIVVPTDGSLDWRRVVEVTSQLDDSASKHAV